MAEDSERRQEIQLNLKSIIENSEKWLEYLRKRESRVRLATSLLLTFLVFGVVGIVFLSLVILLGVFGGLSSFLHQESLDIAVASSIFFVGVVSGIVTYFIIKKKHVARIKELSSLIAKMKEIDAEQAKKVKQNTEGGWAITENAISLVEKIFTLLPELARNRSRDPLIFGLVTFIILEVFSSNLGAAFIAGILVWLYFRYETRKSYSRETSKLEEQKRIFEQRKKEFMDSL